MSSFGGMMMMMMMMGSWEGSFHPFANTIWYLIPSATLKQGLSLFGY